MEKRKEEIKKLKYVVILLISSILEFINFSYQQTQAREYSNKYFEGADITISNISKLFATHTGFVYFQVISLIITFTYILYIIMLFQSYFKCKRELKDNIQ